MTRKTVSVENIKLMINHILANGYDTPDTRLGQIVLVESILHETGNYKGFRYLLANEVPEGELPGIRYGEEGILPYPVRFENTDSTRICFY